MYDVNANKHDLHLFIKNIDNITHLFIYIYLSMLFSVVEEKYLWCAVFRLLNTEIKKI